MNNFTLIRILFKWLLSLNYEKKKNKKNENKNHRKEIKKI